MNVIVYRFNFDLFSLKFFNYVYGVLSNYLIVECYIFGYDDIVLNEDINSDIVDYLNWFVLK